VIGPVSSVSISMVKIKRNLRAMSVSLIIPSECLLIYKMVLMPFIEHVDRDESWQNIKSGMFKMIVLFKSIHN